MVANINMSSFVREENKSSNQMQMKGKGIEGSVFWPGFSLNKLKLCIPDDNIKTRSLNSIFQAVGYDTAAYCRRQTLSWQDNTRGFVQFGSISVF